MNLVAFTVSPLIRMSALTLLYLVRRNLPFAHQLFGSPSLS